MRSPEAELVRSLETEPSGRRNSAPCGRRRQNPRGRQRQIQCDCLRPARTRAPRPPPIELDAEGQALRKRLRAFRTQAVRKNYKASTHLPATLPLSPRVLKCPFSLPALNAQLTSSSVLVTIFRVCSNGDYGVCLSK